MWGPWGWKSSEETRLLWLPSDDLETRVYWFNTWYILQFEAPNLEKIYTALSPFISSFVEVPMQCWLHNFCHHSCAGCLHLFFEVGSCKACPIGCCLCFSSCHILDWIGLHLFNDDTRPSGHISRPSQVGFSHTFYKRILVVVFSSGDQFNLRMSSVGVWFDKELCWISGHSYQIIESSFSQKFYYASFRGRLKEGPQRVNCVVLITTLLQHCTFREYVLNCQSLATMLEAVGGPRDKIWDFVALVWPIRSRVITTSSALVRCRNLLGGPSVGFRRYRSLPCTDISHLIWTSCWM